MTQHIVKFLPQGRKACVVLVLGTMTALGTSFWFGPGQAKQMPEAFQKRQLTADEIVGRLFAENRARARALHRFRGTRVYRVDYHGFFGSHSAEAVVEFDYASPDHRDFTVVSQKGSKFLLDRVIKGLFKGEEEAGAKRTGGAHP